jgi:hypothetical protein
MIELTARWPNEGWAVMQDGLDLHVVPVEGEDSQEPAAGHRLDRGCWCGPTTIPVSDGPMPLDDFRIWSHQEPSWKGANKPVLN